MAGVVIVTGCSSGLGLSTSVELVKEGYHVVGVDVQPSPQETSSTFEFHLLDLSGTLRDEDFSSIIQDRPIHALVCVAGISKGAKLSALTDEDWAHSLQVNLTSVMQLCRSSHDHIVDGGRIVLIGSPVGIAGAKKPSYAASKAGLHGLTMSISREFGPRQILVNTVLPGPMITGMTSDWSDERRESIAQETRLGRLCEPVEVARMIVFLLSKDCTFLTASLIDMTAGSLFGH
jgi:NAD(P)-dependent dehydrogenase (short-subunit alcohol dehydrogenase family)